MRFLNLWVKIFTTFFLPNLSNGQLSTNPSTKPFYLTDGQNGVKSIPYRATDQCMAKTDTNHGKTYGLSFRLHSKGGQCDDGLLICYLGMLNRDAYSLDFKVKGLFQIDNKKDNKLNQYCSSKMQKEGISAGQTNWRGIKLYTMQNGTQNRDTMLEASIASRPYKLGTNVNQFSIHLGGGNGADPFTMITVNDGNKAFVANESNLLKQFREQFWGGAFLREHTGLWMLGLDMLPSMEQENVKLFIARDCNCTMEAWFTQPTDSIEPKEPERQTAGSKNCPIKKIDQTFPVVLPGELPTKIVINATTDVDVNNIIVELFHGDAMDKDGNLLIKFTAGTTADLQVFMPGKATIGVVKNYRLPKGSNKILKIFLFGYCYGISLDGNKPGGIYWPKQWWNRKEVKAIKLNGQMLLLEDPRVEYNKTNLKPMNLPKFWPIAGFREQSTVLIRVQLLNPSKGFKIIFSDKATFDEKINQTAFVVQVVDLKRVELGVYYGGRAHPEQANRKDSSFKAGNAYEFFISVSDRFYGIRLNGENLFENYANSMPFCDIKFVRVEGDAVLLDEPEIYVPPPEKEVEKSVTKALDNVLNYGDSIVLDGQMQNGAKSFRVHLMHNSPRCSKIYDEVAEMEFNLVTGQIECRHKLHEEGGEWTNGGKNSDKLSLLTQKPLNLKILMAKSGFYARDGAANWIEICPYYMPKQKSMAATFIPPWAINHIRIEGDVTLTQEKIRVEKISTGDLQMASTNNVNKTVPWKRIQFMKVIKKEGVDRLNYVVLIKITLKGVLMPDSEVRINFFNEALEVHKLFGSTVLQVQLHNNALSFNSFSNQTWLMPKQNNSYTFAIEPEKDDQKRTIYIFEIRVTNSEFFVKLHGKEKELKYPVDESVRNMDIQYITVELENVKLIAETAVEVSCRPEQRCINQK